jgi:hypothetical protein
MKKLVVMLMLALALCCLLLTPALSSASTPTLKSLAKTVAALQKKVNAQATTISSLRSQLVSAKPVLDLAPYVSLHSESVNGVAGPNVVFQGCNLQIKSATSEDDGSGLGNLIVGWNDESPDVTFRTGSNNLVCGDQNNFNSYGSFLAGCNNATQDPCCSVSGGYGNNTVGNYASVSGGSGNMAGNGACTSVTGGQNNCAFADCSTVSGGEGTFGDPPIGILLRTTDGWSAGGSFHNP